MPIKFKGKLRKLNGNSSCIMCQIYQFNLLNDGLQAHLQTLFINVKISGDIQQLTDEVKLCEQFIQSLNGNREFSHQMEIEKIEGHIELSDKSRSSQNSANMRQDIINFKKDIGQMKEQIGQLKRQVGQLTHIGQMKEQIGQLKRQVGQLTQLMINFLNQQPSTLQQHTRPPLQIKEEQHQEGRGEHLLWQPRIQQRSYHRLQAQHENQPQDEGHKEESLQDQPRSRSRDRQHRYPVHQSLGLRTRMAEEDKKRYVQMIRRGEIQIHEAATQNKVNQRTIYRWLKRY